MNAIALPRMTLNIPAFDHVMNVAARAVDKLDYTPARDFTQNLKLLSLLAMIDCVPYDPAAVEAYKKQKLSEARGWKVMGRFNIKWRRAQINRYTQPIPFDVLETAVKVREAVNSKYLGSATMAVSYLADQEHEAPDPRVYDPFLIVRVGSAQPWHHIAVWDEPGFKL